MSDPDTVVARHFFLVCRQGKVRASFGLSADDRPALTLNDSAGRERLAISLLSDDNPRVELCDANGVCRVALDLVEGKPYFSFMDEEGNTGDEVDWSKIGMRT